MSLGRAMSANLPSILWARVVHLCSFQASYMQFVQKNIYMKFYLIKF